MRFLKIMLYFLCIMLAMALLASVLTTISNSVFGSVKLSDNENIIRRLGFDTLHYSLFSFTSFFFLIILFLWLLQVKFQVKVIYVTLLSVTAGFVFSYLTKRSIWGLDIRHNSELSYVVVISTCMMLFPYINKKVWELFKKEVVFFRNILYFLFILLVMAALASILTTSSDFALCIIKSSDLCKEGNIFQKLGFYLVYYFSFSFITLFFLIIIALLVLQLKFRFKNIYLALLGGTIGFVFGFFTRRSIMSLYRVDREAEFRYILVVTICMILFPFINKMLWKLFNRKKTTPVS